MQEVPPTADQAHPDRSPEAPPDEGREAALAAAPALAAEAPEATEATSTAVAVAEVAAAAPSFWAAAGAGAPEKRIRVRSKGTRSLLDADAASNVAAHVVQEGETFVAEDAGDVGAGEAVAEEGEELDADEVGENAEGDGAEAAEVQEEPAEAPAAGAAAEVQEEPDSNTGSARMDIKPEGAQQMEIDTCFA